MPTLVRDVMAADVVTIDAGALLLEALQLMIDKDVKSLVVNPRHEHDAYGILTFTDIAAKAVAADERLEMLNVYDLMTKPAVSVDQQWEIRYAARMLTDLKISRAIVKEGPALLGIVSLTDLVKGALDKHLKATS